MQSAYDKIQYYKIGQKQKASLIAKLKAFLAKEERIQSAWLFGSFTQRDSIRDIDLAIHAEPELTFKEYLNLNAQIELEIGIPLDLVEISKVPSTLKENILKNGTKVNYPRLPPRASTKLNSVYVLFDFLTGNDACSSNRIAI